MSSGVERCRGVSSGVEGCRGVSRCRVWHLDTVEHGTSLDGVEGCRGVSRGVELVELAWGVEVSSWCRVGVEVWCRGVEARAQVVLFCLVLRRRRLPVPCSRGFFRLSAQLRFFFIFFILCGENFF